MTHHYLVTGASSGLGRSVAESLIEDGNNVTLLTTTSKPEALRLVHPKALAILPYIGDSNHLISQLTDTVRLFQPFDGIVHCGGVEIVRPLRMTRPSDWSVAMMPADQAMTLLRAAAQAGMMAINASIVMISSIAAQRGTSGMVAYAACKGAIEAMARSAAVELAPKGIRVNCIAPGAFYSPMHMRVTRPMTAETVAEYEAKHPLGVSTTEDVRNSVLFLLSSLSRRITGTTMVVDGGFTA